MAGKSKTSGALRKRVRKLEAKLTDLQPGHPSYTHKKRLLQQEIQLAKAQINQRRSKRGGRSAASSSAATTAAQKKPPLPGGASFPSFQLPSPKSPTFYEDSIKSLGQLRSLCKQCVTYMQRADQMMDSLHGVGSNLHSAGVLPKLMKGNVKELTTGDWASLLMAFLNSPISGAIFGGGGGGASGESESAAEKPAQDGEAS
ncbi:hypothetical protein [Tumebacillus lipolyticus]|uniref:Uncharacterized protein n=1 Tax=Tumebacillus lipolyticus TaxID=1280370 RepID=A0ABW4ZYC0_9BACL